MLKIYELRCEYKHNPVGIDVLRPRLFWKLFSEARGAMQSAYQVQVAQTQADLEQGKRLAWDSGKHLTDQAIHVVYAGAMLTSRQRYYWRVRVWDEAGQDSPWSVAAFWEMGLLHPRDWQAALIRPDLKEDPAQSQPCPLLRREITLHKDIRQARLYITAQGLYEAWINGTRVGDELFTPGWTTYHKCLQYQIYDITPLVQQGPNAIGVILADGWYRGYISYTYDRTVYGDRLGLLAQLEITYQDGSRECFGTDASWKCSTGPWLEADLFNGETYDARLEHSGWGKPGFRDEGWGKVTPVTFDTSILAAPRGLPVRAIQELKPVAILTTPKGETVIDFGQNIAGRVRLSARGARGTKITIRHGEVLDLEGNFFDQNLRMAKATDRFILAGTGAVETFEPRFTFHGFRYAMVQGYPGELTLDAAIAVVIHSDLERTGDFSCSNDLVNRLFQNIVWSQRGNFLDVPTDCPQRDERLGWTGDIQVFAPTACLTMNSGAFLTRWLQDLAVDQEKSGAVPMVIPDPYYDKIKSLGRILDHRLHPRQGDEKDFFDELIAIFVMNHCAAWGDAAVIVPWVLYQAYGDTRMLEDQYASMQALLNFHLKRAGGITSLLLMNPLKWFQAETWKHLKYYYTANMGFGDWLAPGDGMDKSFFKSPFYVPTVYMALDALIISQAAEVLGKNEDAASYRSLYDKIREAYRYFKIGKNGRLKPHRQSAYVLALMAGLIPEPDRARAAATLAHMVRQDNYKLQTGFLGTPQICRILCEYGFVDEAYGLLLNQEHKWLYQVGKGATTIWEHWDAIKSDGSYQNARMLSFNHYAYGSIGAWLFQDVAGINTDPTRAGYKHIIIKPQPGSSLDFAQATYDSIHGPIRSAWRRENDRLHLDVEIPANTTATVIIPPAFRAQVSENGTPVTLEKGAVKIGSGVYAFECIYTQK